ncbi:MAG: hypothetical protein ACRYGC_17670 [Janthinobacterium lividum]
MRARGWAGAAVLASAVLLAPVLAAAQGAAQPVAPAAAPDTSAMTPTRMPRAGSSGSLEREGTGHAARKTAQQRFEDANTSHDGHLTEAQAQAAHMRGVATHFAEIDSHHRGYITFDEIHSWRAERRAEHKAAREKAAK